MEDEFVRQRKWLTSNEFIDVVTLINALPGVIAFNSSLIIGRKVAGIGGGAAALLGALLPSVLVILLLAPLIGLIRAYPVVAAAFTSARAAVAALILLLLLRHSSRTAAGVREFLLAVSALAAVRIAGIHPILVIPVSALIGIILFGKEERKSDSGDQE
jgi:chromate transporter